MTNRYALVIEFVPDFADYPLLAGRCIKLMHSFLYDHTKHLSDKTNHFLAAGFPRWDENGIGNTIAFFSHDRDLLVGLSYNRFIRERQDDGTFIIHTPFQVADSFPPVRFVRNTTIGKLFAGSQKREAQRMVRRGIQPNLEHICYQQPVREFDAFHSIPIDSKKRSVSTGQAETRHEFILHVQREHVDEHPTASFNSYGLATNKHHRGTVPDIEF